MVFPLFRLQALLVESAAALRAPEDGVHLLAWLPADQAGSAAAANPVLLQLLRLRQLFLLQAERMEWLAA